MTDKWTTADIPNLTGKIVVITGANSGLGYESSLALAQKGAHVVMACRSPKKADSSRFTPSQKHSKPSTANLTSSSITPA